jgi:hypothetical protein
MKNVLTFKKEETQNLQDMILSVISASIIIR